jgi:hypothetical protein
MRMLSQLNTAVANENGVFILGMHRSGTSVLAGLLHFLGYSAGTGKLVGSTEHNPKGYFEMESLVIQNQDWLIQQKVSWGNGMGKFDASEARLNETGLETLLSLNVPEPWMMKDPRLCISLPAWDPYFKKPPPVVFTYRHPLSVALSLCQRSTTELFYGLKSWIYHNMHAIHNMRGRCVVRTSHKTLMDNPVNEIVRISSELAEKCGLSTPPSPRDDEFGEKVDEFVSASLHHYQEVIEQGIHKGTLLEMFRDCSFPRTLPTTDGNMEIYHIAMKVHADLESGAAFEDSYSWPKLPYMSGSRKKGAMKIWRPKPKTEEKANLEENARGAFVIGMHHSGTFALAGIMNTIGFSTPNGTSTEHSNPTVSHELNHLVVKQNERWISGSNGEFDPSQAKLSREGKSVLLSIQRETVPWILSDPRLAITLPAWLGHFNRPPSITFIYRHPFDVALNLRREFGKSIYLGLKSWLYYNQQAIKNSEGLCLVRTNFKDLAEYPWTEALRLSREISTKCGLPARVDKTDTKKEEVEDVMAHHARSQIGLDSFSSASTGECSHFRPAELEDSDIEIYEMAVKVYCDIETGKALRVDYEWGTLSGWDSQLAID